MTGDALWQPPHRAYGKIAGLPQRLADWVGRVKYDKALPWIGLGMTADMEAVLRLLSLEEFGQWLVTHTDDELQRWGVEVLDAAADRDELLAAIDEHLPEGDTATAAIEHAGETLADVRKVLVDCGALTADDTETPVADLLRVLLA